MAGLKICTRCRAISARRSRRISSSLLPENIGPTTTSIHPMLPFTMSTQSLLAQQKPSRPRSCRRPVHLCIVERCKGRNHCQTERFLARNQVAGQHAPSSLPVPNANFARKAINSRRKFHPANEHLFGQRFRQFDTSRAPEVPASTVGNIGPALQEYAMDSVFHHHVEPALEADKEPRGRTAILQPSRERLRSLPRSAHQLFTRLRRVTNPA